jgi:Fe-S-cluster containining protein
MKDVSSVCQNCGWCCNYYYRRIAEKSDILRWIENSRSDILQYFIFYKSDGSVLTDLSELESSIDSVIDGEMKNSGTGEFYDKCPFLIEKSDKYYCSIHETKPKICKDYIPWERDIRINKDKCPVVLIIKKN